MKRPIVLSFIIFAILLLFQFGSYYFLGKKSASVSYCKHIHPLIKNVGKVVVFVNAELKSSEISSIKNSLNKEFDIVAVITNPNELSKYVKDSKITLISITADFKFPYRATINELTKSNDYLEVWESKMYWILGK